MIWIGQARSAVGGAKVRSFAPALLGEGGAGD
jgi:hypothetical protein